MAKKQKFSIDNLQLPKADPIKKTAKVQTDDAVEKIHKKKTGRPKREEAVTRLTVDLPKSVHRQLKMRAIENDSSLRNLVISILMREVEK